MPIGEDLVVGTRIPIGLIGPIGLLGYCPAYRLADVEQ